MRLILVFLLIVSYKFSFSQVTKFLYFDGILRKYLEFVPSSYSSGQNVPLILCLHGLGDNAANFSSYMAMHFVGDTANFITIYPEATPSYLGNAWNSGIYYNGSIINEQINDVGFLLFLIDTIKKQYNIDTNRIYICGYSMGGFMTQRLACEAGNNITAIASVAGTIGNALNCNPQKPIPVCHFHGTNDNIVPYYNNPFGLDPEELINFWKNINHSDGTVIFNTMPDIANDSIIVETYLYPCPQSNDVLFYKAIGPNAQHQWFFLPAFDISYTFEIWRFFRQYNSVTSYTNTFEKINQTHVYPNPASDYLFFGNYLSENIQKIELYDANGDKIFHVVNPPNKVSISFLPSGYYFVRIITQHNTYTEKISIIRL
ncbi:MAG: T9SS type A sorting domain-containing protein [Bacteroidales bacterium]|nr:T9SS type A sorting domain-containing protein [Bacteroidales bacterium]